MLLFAKLLGCICLANFIATSKLIDSIKCQLAKHLIHFDKTKYIATTPPYLYTKSIPPFDCPKCLTFWLTALLLYYNSYAIDTIITVSFLNYQLSKLINK